MISTGPNEIRVRDVVRSHVHFFSPDSTMLRVPYDLFHPRGPVRVHDGIATYAQGDAPTDGRVAAATLAEARPGERVLLHFPASLDGEGDADAETWWLCEIVEKGADVVSPTAEDGDSE